MIATILGDIIGIPYEHNPVHDRNPNFSPLFHPEDSRCTDDTVLTLAVASAILKKRANDIPYKEEVLSFAKIYHYAGYGGGFKQWFKSSDPQPYYSFANGAAMRVGPVGWAFETIEEVLAEAEKSAKITHNHPEGIKGAQAIALAVFLARKGKSKNEIKDEIKTRFGYHLDLSLQEIITTFTENKEETGKLDTSAAGNVPQAIVAFLESTDVESAIRIAVSLGGDADTLAAMAGSIAEAFYQNDQKSVAGLLAMVKEMKKMRTEYGPYLDNFLLHTTISFYEKYIPDSPVIALLKT
jgi:ADP-ribosylglycohydrolase